MTRINTNVESLVARRALGNNNNSLNQALQRLSTGLRINTGADDPAGLIASETLRSNITAIDQAIGNATRADTVVAIAEGGLQEISSILLELESLIDQTANQAGLTNEEVSANQLQIDSLLATINRIADTTSFGDKRLLNGSFGFQTSGVATSSVGSFQINSAKIPNGGTRQVNVDVLAASEFAYVSAIGSQITGGGATGSAIASTVTLEVKGKFGTEILSFASGTSTAEIVTAINSSKDLTGVSAVTSGGGTAGSPTSIIFSSTTYGSDAFVSVAILDNESALDIGGASVSDYGTDGTITINGASATVKGLNASVRSGAFSADFTFTADFAGTAGSSTSFDITGGGATFSISPVVGLVGEETIGINAVTAGSLGSMGTGFLSSLQSGLSNDLGSQNFGNAQRIVREAINQVATLRGRLGAFQANTLRTTVNSLQVARENVTAAESAIRDADFAAETAALTRAQILVNSSTATLQIANSQPQSVLSLLG